MEDNLLYVIFARKTQNNIVESQYSQFSTALVICMLFLFFFSKVMFAISSASSRVSQGQSFRLHPRTRKPHGK